VKQPSDEPVIDPADVPADQVPAPVGRHAYRPPPVAVPTPTANGRPPELPPPVDDPDDDFDHHEPEGVPGGRPIGPNLLSKLLVVTLIVGALLVAGVVVLVWGDDAKRGASSNSSGASSDSDVTRDPTIGRRAGVTDLLQRRGEAVRDHDKEAFLSLIDPTAEKFRAEQSEIFDRLVKVPLADWSYELAGEGPGLPADRALALPRGSTIARVRLNYRFDGSDSPVEREQYLTVVPRGGQWLIASNDDAVSSGLQTERDIWDLGPLRVVRGSTTLVLGDADAPKAELESLAKAADRGVRDVGGVWHREWSRHPVIVYPKSQTDMATLIGSDGKGLSQIAAVTTGSFESGLSRGDRVVVNPDAWRTLGSLGRRVVLAHEMTHLATRAITVDPVPIWLSEGFADYVAYEAIDVPTNVVAGDVLDDVRDGKDPKALPDDKDFDASQGDIAAAYEGAWLACRMIAERYGQKQLISLYVSLADSTSPPAGGDIKATLGITEQTLVKQWRSYLFARAKA
jgi:hypothetical protein